MRRRIVPILVLLVLFLLTGCAGKQETGGDSASVVVGFSQLGAESSWRIANTVSMEQAAKDAGYGLMMENANQKQEKQIDAIRSFIAYRVDVIVFSPIVETGWDNVLTEAKQAGIPVILMDRMIETQDDSLYFDSLYTVKDAEKDSYRMMSLLNEIKQEKDWPSLAYSWKDWKEITAIYQFVTREEKNNGQAGVS